MTSPQILITLLVKNEKGGNDNNTWGTKVPWQLCKTLFLSYFFLSVQIKTQEVWDVSAGCWSSYPSSLLQQPSQSHCSCVLRYSIFSVMYTSLENVSCVKNVGRSEILKPTLSWWHNSSKCVISEYPSSIVVYHRHWRHLNTYTS